MAIEDVYELAYREAVRALEHQRATLSELRGRASMLLAAASITVSLPGPKLRADGDPLAWTAVAAFVLLSAAVLTIVWPRDEWRFDTNARDLLEKHLALANGTAASLTLELISQLTVDLRANGPRLTAIALAFRAGTFLLAIQMVSTVLAFSGII